MKNHGLADFWRRLDNAPNRILLLDYDGTLAPFRVERNEAVPYPGIREILSEILADGGTRIVIISGRATEDVLPLLGLDPHPEIWGCHGWERLLPDGTRHLEPPPPAAVVAMEKGAAWAREEGFGAHCERKPVSLAFHWRGIPALVVEDLEEQVSEKWQQLAREGGMELHPFDGGIELRLPGVDKGSAVETILSETEGGSAVAYLGDDLTDEDAFRALEGKGLGVLVRAEWRPTAAAVWLRPPGELMAFLRRWREACKQGKE